MFVATIALQIGWGLIILGFCIHIIPKAAAFKAAAKPVKLEKPIGDDIPDSH